MRARLLTMAAVPLTLAALPPGVAEAQRFGRSAFRAMPPAAFVPPRAAESRAAYEPARRPRCERTSGGSILGAIAGGLLGGSAADGGDRALAGTGAGTLAGRGGERGC